MCGIDVLVKEFERIPDALFSQMIAPETPLNPFRTPFERPPGAPASPPAPSPTAPGGPPEGPPKAPNRPGSAVMVFWGTISRKCLILKGVKKCCVFSLKVHLHRPGLGCNGLLAFLLFFNML